MDTVRLLALCIVGAVFAVILKESKKDYSLLVVLGCAVIIMVVLVADIATVGESIGTMLSGIPISSDILRVVIKALGISILCELAAAMCRDMGEGTMALKSELVGRVALAVITLPLANELLSRLDWLLAL